MIIQEIKYAIYPEKVDQYFGYFSLLSDYTLSLDDVLSHELYRDLYCNNEFFLITHFKTKESAEVWYQSEQRSVYLDSAKDCFMHLHKFDWYEVSRAKNVVLGGGGS